MQRINLTTALGTSLVNTLFVLDEPSIGLHPRDIGRVIGVMHRLRDAGNSLVVVEHDPQVMLAADRILDIGPGPGERGGEIVFFGTPEALRGASTSITADYLAGRKRTAPPAHEARIARDAKRLELIGAAEHNLKNIDVAIPLNALVCVTGVSGSGKSTLVQDVLYPALLRAKGKPTEAPGAFRVLVGDDLVGNVLLIDQTPIGRTTRSNPASYVGAFDCIRKRFAALAVAKERGYTQGTFSFNAGNGRCPTCGGNGFEHVEMQFLSDVYLRCPDCDGKRFRREVLEVHLRGRSIADVLEMTVAQACAFFAGERDIESALRPLVAVGLEYLKLGQPVPTLSGGEAQRLKLAGQLAEAARGEADCGKLFLFDEPTTGLHFDDVAKLLRAFRELVAAGHSLVVIEHNLDVIGAADWIIDLGPEGGDAGGRVVFAGLRCAVARLPVFAHRRRPRRVSGGIAAPAAIVAREPGRAGGQRQRDPHPQRARAQPEEHRRRNPARPFHRHHRDLRQWQEHARVRHPVRRGAAPLSRVAERVRAAVRAARRTPRGRRDLRHSADGCDRAANEPRWPQEHRRDADRDLPLPAAAVREARHAALPRSRRRRSRRRPKTASWHRCFHGIVTAASCCSRRSSSRAKATTPISRSGLRAAAWRSCASMA